MADKFWNTQNKKIMATVALLITGWFAIIMGGNPFKFPALPDFVTNMMGSISLLLVAGFFTLYTIFLIWTEY